MGEAARIAESVIDSDPVAIAIKEFADLQGEWSGSAQELLQSLTPNRAPKGWPQSPQAMGGRLKRLKPALEQVGILVEQLARTAKQRTWVIRSQNHVQHDVTNVITSPPLVQQTVLDDNQVTINDELEASHNVDITNNGSYYSGF